MGKLYDFVFTYNPKVTTQRDLTLMIYNRIFIRRLQYNKPCIFFIGGDSGEGKSNAALMIEQEVLDMQGLKLEDFIDDINIFTPFEYSRKMKNILFDPRLKKIHFICIHEARELMNSKDWQEFLTRSIASINALSRAHKRLVIIIVAQFVGNVAKEIRQTFNFYSTVWRPANLPARLYLKYVWKDDRDLEKTKLQKRQYKGYLVNSITRQWRQYIPEYIEMKKVRKEVWDKFEKLDKEAKMGMMQNKLNKLLEHMKKEIGAPSEKINNMVNFYTNNGDQLTNIGKRRAGKFVIGKEFKLMHGLNDAETEEFSIKLNEKLKGSGLMKKLNEEVSNEQ